MIIDFHTHTGRGKIRCDAKDVLASMKKYGIDRSVVFPMSVNHGSVVDESFKNLADQDDRFSYFLRFNPKVVTPRQLLEMEDKFAGFKMHPRGEKFDPLDRRFSQIFRALESIGKPVLIHSRKEGYPYSDPDRMIRLAERYEGINFVFGHFASDSDVFFERMRALDNAFVETSIVSSPKIIEMRVDLVGADKILFGSDFPFSDQEIELLKIRKSAIKESDRQKILYKNAARLLGKR